MGLAAGQLGCFRTLPVVALGVAVGSAAAWALGRSRLGTGSTDGTAPPRAAGRRQGWRGLGSLLVFAIAAALYLPGYDTTIYGSDATVYLGTGIHLARTGSLAIKDELLPQFPADLREQLFPSYAAHGGPGTPHQRSPAGLAFAGDSPGKVYSTFSQLPSVWLAIAYGIGGARGARAATPLLGAAALACFYLFLRGVAGPGAGLVAVGLLIPAAPQLQFARFSTGEIGGQFFLWAALVALARWYEDGSRTASAAAGLGLGLAALARPEYIVFVPLAAILAWLARGRGKPGLPRLATAIAAAMMAHALALILFFIPTHYRPTMGDTLRRGVSALVHTAAARPAVVLLAAAAVIGAGLLTVWRTRRSASASAGGIAARGIAAAGIALWALLYAYLADSPPGTGLWWLPLYTSWPVLALGAAGFPLLVRTWWRHPAAQFALLLCAAAAAHFFYDPRTVPVPFWGARRLLGAPLPLFYASAATAVAALASLTRPLALVVAAVALITNLRPAWPLLKRPYFRHTGEAAAAIAALVPKRAVVVIGPGLLPSLLDVPLWLVHGRETVQLRGYTGSTRHVRALARAMPPGRPLYMLRHGLLKPPVVPGLTFASAGARQARLFLPGVEVPGHPGVAARSLLTVRAFRVELARPPAGGE